VRDLTISLLQTELHWQDPAANRAHFDGLIDAIDRAADTPHLVMLPEVFTSGFSMDGPPLAETMDGESVAWMKLVAQDYGVTVCGSLIIEDAGRYFNRLVWAPPDGDVRWYDKRHLFRMAGEHERYSAGAERRIFKLCDWRVCPLVCYDLRFPVWSRGIDEFDLLLYVANWPAPRRSAWRTLLPARAVENLCYCAGLNRIGIDGRDLRYSGDSGVFDFLGDTLVDCGDEDRTATVTLDGARLERFRSKFPAHLDADKFSIDQAPR